MRSTKPRTFIRLTFFQEHYPAIRRLINEPTFHRGTFLAAAEVGAMYLYAHDHERNELLNKLSARMRADFEAHLDQFSSAHGLNEGAASEPRTRKGKSAGSVPIYSRADGESQPVSRKAPRSQTVTKGAVATGPSEALPTPPRVEAQEQAPSLSPTATGLMASFGQDFISPLGDPVSSGQPD